MSQKKRRVPSYCLHKKSGRAVIRLNGKDHYLGEFGCPESHTAYQRLIQQWLLVNAASTAKKRE